MRDLMNISASPHIRDNSSVRRIMLDVIIALLPAAAYGVYHFGLYALFVILTCVVTCILTEALFQKLTGRDITVTDGSAALTGLLIAMNMPPRIPIYVPVIGCVFAIIMVKQIFGGLGHNFMNPALAARCFLLISFARHMSYFPVDGVSSATPLMVMRESGTVDAETVYNLFIGNVGGAIGETCALALLAGGVYLVLRKVISPVIPLTFIGTFAAFTALFSGHLMQSDLLLYILAQIFGGGLMLGAIFMATDYATSPITTKGKIIYGVFIGVLSGLFRIFGISAKGISYSIIIGNMVTPLIDVYTRPRAFGEERLPKTAKEKAEPVREHNKEKYSAPVPVKIKSLSVMICITLIAGAALGYVYLQTKDIIIQRQADDTRAAYAAVCENAERFDAVEDDFEALLSSADADYGNIEVGNVFVAVDSGNNKIGGVADITTKDGYGGDIRLVVGVDSEYRITGVEVLEISETAGLGMNAERDIIPQYKGKSGALGLTKDGGEIEAISGATITSKAVTNTVNAALYILSNLKQ